MKKLSIILLTFLSSLTLYAQVDTEFWFACPDLSSIHFDYCIRLCVTTFSEPATVTISQPANPSFHTITQQVAANSYANISLRDILSQVETTPGAVRKTGLFIQSTSKVTVYYANYCDNSEIYSLKGKNALGTDFIVPTQFSYDSSDQYGGSSTIEIVATEDNTSVDITPSHKCVGHPAGQTFTITLNRGETYAVKANGMSALSHLFNTRITSNKPIAVNYTDDSLEGPGADLIGDQLVPLNLIGQQYVAIGYSGSVEELYFFPTVEDTTHVYSNGTLIATLEGTSNVTTAGKGKLILANGAATYLSADHPILVLQVTRNGREPGAALLPPIVCTGSDEIAYKYTQSSGAAFSLVCKTSDIDGFTLNGQAYMLPATYFMPVPGAPEWSYTYKSAPTDYLRIKNTKGIFHMAVIDNPGTTCSLGYFSNFNTVPLGVGSNQAYYLEDNTLQLSIQNPENFENIFWRGPNGFTSTEANPVIDNVTELNAGTYIVSADHKEGCTTTPDTIRVSVFRPRTHQVSVCYGSNAHITAEGFAPFTWTPASLGTEKTVSIPSTTPGTYRVESHKQGTNRISPIFQSVPTSQPNECVWRTTISNVTIDVDNAFSARFTSSTNETAPTLRFFINGQAVGDTIRPTADGVQFNYQWTAPTEIATLSLQTTANSRANAAVEITELCFAPVYAVTDTFVVSIRDSLLPILAGDAYCCHAKAMVHTEEEYDSYLWSNGQTTRTATFTEAGNVWVQVAKDDCTGTGYYDILDPAAMSLQINPLPKICHGDSVATISYNLTTGDIESFDILFDETAHAAGFTDQMAQIPTGEITVPIPPTAEAGLYGVALRFLEPICQDVATLPITLQLRYANTILQRWNDVLGIANATYNDGGHDFIAYQWYKNDSILEGETQPYLYIANGTLSTEDTYTALLTLADSTQVFTCDYVPIVDPKAEEQIQFETATLVTPASRMQVKGIQSDTQATFYTSQGAPLSHETLTTDQPTLLAPNQQGIYMLVLTTETEHKALKIVVR